MTGLAASPGANDGGNIDETVERAFLIADVRGYTRFTREHGDVEAARLAMRFAELAHDAVESRNGRLVELRGDEAMAVFDSATLAIRAGIELAALCADGTASDNLPLLVGVGIEIGDAVAVEGGFRGAVLNMAARLCSQAAGGQVLVTTALAARAGEIANVQFVPAGAAELKGFETPIDLMEAVAVERPRPSLEPGTLPLELEATDSLVGRSGELAGLRGAWRQTARGFGRVMIVSGPPGIGKTRLAAALAGFVHPEGGVVSYAGAGGTAVADALSALDPDDGDLPAAQLIVLDDFDAIADAVAPAIEQRLDEIEASPMLILCLLRDPELDSVVEHLVATVDDAGDGHRRLDRLGADHIREIARKYAGEDIDSVPLESIARASDGLPSRVHELMTEWAGEEATRRLAAAAEFLAAERRHRGADLKFANNAITLKLGRLYDAERADVVLDHGDSPYKGLASFEQQDSGLFFGREQLVGELAARTVGSGLVAIVGASGSGKSSVIAAGLIPSLRAGLLPGSERWASAVVRPGEQPLAKLASLDLSAESRVVLVVDQLEELFTLCDDEDERSGFVEHLVQLAADPERIVVVVGLRGDYYGHFGAYPEFARLIAANQVIVGSMSSDELRRAIELPARRAGVRVESALSDALVHEIAAEPGGLPLLSTALVELWQERDGEWLRLAAHERLGGARGAVARLGEGTYQQLSAEECEACRGLLLRLAVTGEEGVLARRRVPRSELDLERDPVLGFVVERLTTDRLLTAHESSLEVSHEALLREWPRFQQWLAEEGQGRELRERLTQSARRWESSGHDSAELYRGARLSATLDWSVEHERELNELERGFLAESRAESEHELARQRRTNRRLRGLLVGVAVFLGVALVTGVLALIQRSQAKASATRATRAATVSLANTVGADGINQPRLDRGLLLAREAMNLHVSEQTESNLLSTVLRNPQQLGAIYFGDTGTRPQRLGLSPDGRVLAVTLDVPGVAFYDASTLKRLALVPSVVGGPIAPLVFANHAPLFATYGDPNSDMRLIDTRTFRPVRWIRFHQEYANPNYSVHLTGLFFSANDKKLWWGVDVFPPNSPPTARPRSVIESYSTSTGRLLSRTLVARDWQIGFAPIVHGSQLLVVDRRAALVYDARTQRLVRTIPLHDLNSADFRNYTLGVSPTGKIFVVGRPDGSVEFVDLKSGRTSVAVGGHSAAIADLRFTPDGNQLITVGNDNKVVVWDTATRTVTQTLLGHGGWVHGLATDGLTIYTASVDGTVFVWDLAQTRSFGQHFAASSGNFLGDPIDTGGPYFGLSPDGHTLAAPQGDGRLLLWDISTSPARRLRGIKAVAPGGTSATGFSPDGKALLAGDLKGHLVVTDLSTGARRSLAGFKEPIAAAAFSPYGNVIAATSGFCAPPPHGCSAELGIWRVATRAMTRRLKLPGFGNDVAFSPDGSILAVPASGLIDVVDVRTGKVIRQVKPDGVYAAFSPDGRVLATTGQSGLLHLWDTRTWKELGQPVEVSAGFGLSLSFDPSGRLLATAGTDGTVRTFDVSDPIHPLPFGPPTFPTGAGWTSAQFTPDGSSLVVMDEQGHAWVWPMRWTTWAAHACAVAARQLSRAEWNEFLGNQPYRAVCQKSQGKAKS